MAGSAGPNITENGAVFYYDTGNTLKSYKGEPTTNLIPNASVNALPTYGNGWGTYNTNQYCGNNGCAVFWDIPAIAAVSSNIVTTVSAHPIRSFDVIRPETSGGGLTANVNYVAKKISDTQFSLHAYNSSQDGSQGYINPSTGGHKVHDSYWLDQRVSVNASSFPTKWWGAPHLPNSAIVKEIITNGFDLDPLRKTDCIRLHWFRTDATDGMAYGVNAGVTIGQPVTTSFYVRAASASAVGQYIAFQHYNYSGPAGYSGFYMNASTGALGEWVRCSFTFTPTHNALISYWFPSSANMKIDVADIQIEQKSHATPFTTGTRSATQGLVDLTGTSTIDLANVSFDSNAQMTFDGTDEYINMGDLAIIKLGTNFTIECVVKPEQDKWMYFFHKGYGQNNSLAWGRHSSSDNWFFSTMINGSYQNTYMGTATLNQYCHLVASYDGNNLRLYENGDLKATVVTTHDMMTSTQPLGIGGPDRYWNGEIPVTKVYSRALTAQEVKQNYQGIRKRFGL